MKPLEISELGCADGRGREMGAENCADGCGRPGCKGLAGNGWGEEAAGDQRAWLRRRLRTGNGCGELHGRLRTAWVQGSGWEMGGEKKPLVMSELGCADGCGRDMGAKNCADGCGRRELLEMGGDRAGDERAWLRGRLRTGNGYGCARRGVQGSGWKCGAEQKPLVMSELGCADGCGRQMGGENCADGCGRRGCEGVAARTLWTANGCGELRGRLRTAWVQGSGWKWFGRRSRWG